MKTLQIIEYDGHKCWFREVDDAKTFLEARKKFYCSTMCFLTHEPLNEYGIVMIINNNKLFQNCFINKSALEKFDNDYHKITALLRNEYKEAQKYAHWFA